MTPLYINVNLSKANSLVQGPQYPRTPASFPDLVSGNRLPLKVAFVDGNPDGTGYTPWNALAGYTLRLSVTRNNKYAESGLIDFEATLATFDITSAALKTLLNASYVASPSKEVAAVDGSLGDFTIYFKNNGAQTPVAVSVLGLRPICNVRVDVVQAGTVDRPEIQRIVINQAPIAEVTDWVLNGNFYEGVLPLDNTVLSELMGRQESVKLWVEAIVTDPDGNPVTYLLREVSILNGFGGEPGVPATSTLDGLVTRNELNQTVVLNRSDITDFAGGEVTKLDSIATVSFSAGVLLVFIKEGVKYYALLKAGTAAEDLVSTPIIVRPDDYNTGTNAKYWEVTTTKGDTGEAGEDGSDGEDGEDGLNGAPGTAGADGNGISAGSVDPDDADGIDGDLYLNTTSKDLFKKTAGTWVFDSNIGGGPAGAAAKFTKGAGSPDDGDGLDGYGYINTSNGDLYIKDAGTWGSPVTNLIGPIGLTGTRGSKWWDGSGAPGTITGSLDGDYYLRTSNSSVYKKVSGSWGSPLLSLVGAPGNQFRVGTGTPSVGLGADGDMYLDDATGDLYKKSGGVWGSPVFTIGTGSGGGTWGSITGTLSDQTDLQTALDALSTAVSGKAATIHTHAQSDITGLAAALAAKLEAADIAGKADSTDTRFPSSGEKSALAGTDGTPGSGNKFVTDSDPRLTDSRAPAAHTHAQSDVTGLVAALATKLEAADIAGKADLNIGISTKSANYTLVSGDRNSLVRVTASLALLLPNIATGAVVQVQVVGDYTCTLSPDTGITINGATKLIGDGAYATLVQISSTVWQVLTLPASKTLLNGLISYWPLDEYSGTTRRDAHGTSGLTSSASMGSSGGKIRKRGLLSANTASEAMRTSSGESDGKHDFGNTSFTISAWVKWTAFTTDNNVVIARWNSANKRVFTLQSNVSATTASTVAFIVDRLGTNSSSQYTATSGTVNTGTWYHVVIYFDAARQVIGIILDNGTAVETSTGGNYPFVTTGITTGVATNDNPSYTARSTMSDVGIWGRILTANEITALYNSGSGITYPFAN